MKYEVRYLEFKKVDTFENLILERSISFCLSFGV